MSTPIERDALSAAAGAHAATSMQISAPRLPPHRTFAAEAHHVLGEAWDAIGRFLPFLGQAAANPQVDEAVELLMTAIGLGAEARDLELVLVQLRHIVATLQAPPQPPPAPPAFTPAHAADGNGAM